VACRTRVWRLIIDVTGARTAVSHSIIKGSG
jgi:hypothetical protein